MNMNRWVKPAVSLLMTVGLLLLVVGHLDPGQLKDTLRSVSGRWMAFSLGAFLVYQVFRTLRFDLLIENTGGRVRLFHTQCLHSFFNGFFPAGLGEGVFVFLLRRLHAVPLSSGISTVFVVRILDLLIFVAIFLILLIRHYRQIPAAVVIGMLAVGVACILVVGGALKAERIPFLPGRGLIISRQGRVTRFVREVFTEFKRMLGSERIGRLILFSVLMWGAMFVFFFTVVHALGFGYHWYEVLVIYVMLVPFDLLPIKGIANLGTHEAAWVLALMLIGVGQNEATVLAFGSHILFLTVTTLQVILPLVYFGTKSLRTFNGTHFS